VYFADGGLQNDEGLFEGNWQLYLLLVGLAIVAVMGGLFFYRSKKKQKQPTTAEMVNSATV